MHVLQTRQKWKVFSWKTKQTQTWYSRFNRCVSLSPITGWKYRHTFIYIYLWEYSVSIASVYRSLSLLRCDINYGRGDTKLGPEKNKRNQNGDLRALFDGPYNSALKALFWLTFAKGDRFYISFPYKMELLCWGALCRKRIVLVFFFYKKALFFFQNGFH